MYVKLHMKNAGIYYLCNPCSEPVTQEGREDKLPGGRKGTKAVSSQRLEPEVVEVTEASQSEAGKNDEIKDVSDSDDSDEDDFQETPKQKKKKKREEKRREKEEEKEEKKEKCKFYMRNKCNHGIWGEKCRFLHPKRCSKWMKAGMDGCRKCDLFHPPICFGSINHKKCEKPECTFIHLPGTVRSKPKEAGERKKTFPLDGGPRQEKLNCIMCPSVCNTEKELTHNVNTVHSHKCPMCGNEVSSRQDIMDHNCQAQRRMGGGPARNFPPAGLSNKSFLVNQPLGMEGQKEIMQSVNSMVEMMKQSHLQNQNMMTLLSQLVQKQQQPQVMPAGWRMPGM